MEAYSAPLLFLATVIKMAEAEEAKTEGRREGRHEKVDNGGRIYRTRTAVAHGKEEEERRGEEEAGRSHTTYALGRTGTHPCMHASLHSVSESCPYIKAHFMDALI